IEHVCPMNNNGVLYQSWIQNFDCVYYMSNKDVNSYTFIEITHILKSEQAKIIIMYDNATYFLEDIYGPQGVFLAEPLAIPITYNGFAVKWFPSRRFYRSAHAITLAIDHEKSDCLPFAVPSGVVFTLTTGNQLGSVAQFKCVSDKLVLRGARRSECLIDCLPFVLPSGVVFTLTTGNQLGSVAQFKCVHDKLVLRGARRSECLIGGKWSHAPPICAVGQCSQPEYCYNTWNALTRANYDPPRYIFPTNPFRVCYTVDKSTYVWSDFNFNFQVLFCTAYPLDYGYFEKQFYNTGQNGSIHFYANSNSIIVATDFIINTLPGILRAINSDINECAKNIDLCDPDATCMNYEASRYLVKKVSCLCKHSGLLCSANKGAEYRPVLGKTCASEDLPQDKGLISVNWKKNYRHNETATLLCNVSNSMFVEFEALCLFGEWKLSPIPCDETCPKTLGNKDVVSGTGNAALFEHMHVQCKDENQIMIGSGEIICGRGGRWLSEPICTDIHCPNLNDVIDGSLEIHYSNNTTINVVGSEIHFKCSTGHLEGPASITCKRGVHTSSSQDIPSAKDFTIVAHVVKPGFFEVSLKGLQKYLRISIQKTGTTTIQSVKLLYTQCQPTTLNGLSLGRSYTFSKPRQVPARCDARPGIATVEAICSPFTGWRIQEPNSCCTLCELLQAHLYKGILVRLARIRTVLMVDVLLREERKNANVYQVSITQMGNVCRKHAIILSALNQGWESAMNSTLAWQSVIVEMVGSDRNVVLRSRKMIVEKSAVLGKGAQLRACLFQSCEG
ncbi:hypothetical protein ANCDUO_11785, partial [Ancylostoma duodenale]